MQRNRYGEGREVSGGQPVAEKEMVLIVTRQEKKNEIMRSMHGSRGPWHQGKSRGIFSSGDGYRRNVSYE